MAYSVESVSRNLTGAPEVDSLLAYGRKWGNTDITYSFDLVDPRMDGLDEPTETSESEQALVRKAWDEIAQVTNITPIETTGAAQINFMAHDLTSVNAAGMALIPNSAGSTVLMQSGSSDNLYL